MKILVTGATGFVGRKLITQLAREGHSIVVLSRDALSAKQKLTIPVTAFSWDPPAGPPPAEAFLGVQAVVHLAGEGIAEKRWSKTQKEKIYSSRITGTRNLMEAIARLPGTKPEMVIAASAIGFYGDRGDETLTEKSPTGSGFLADVCRDWEKALFASPIPGVRVAALRIGIVLGREGGMLKKVIPLFKTGLAGPLGNGRQYMSWIHVDDLVGLFVHALKTSSVEGPLNAVAPHPVTNAYFTSTLGKALSRPAFLPAPAFGLKIALGEMSTLLLGSQKVRADRAVDSGYRFQYERIDQALADICKKKVVSPLKSSELSSGSPTP